MQTAGIKAGKRRIRREIGEMSKLFSKVVSNLKITKVEEQIHKKREARQCFY